MAEYQQHLSDLFGEEPQFKGVGQINYEAFAAILGWRIDGQRMPLWPQLADREQQAWHAAAGDVLQKGWVEAQPGRQGRRRR